MESGNLPPRKRGAAEGGQVAVDVSTRARPDFDQPLVAFAFDKYGNLVDRKEVKSGKLVVDVAPERASSTRLFLAPASAELMAAEVTPRRLRALGAYEQPLASRTGELVRTVDIPGPILEFWPFCLCVVRGRVVRSADGRAVCGARVHVCEVDRLPLWILRLPDLEVVKLRDDLLDALRRPIPRPPFPPRPGPLGPIPRPGPDPAPFADLTALRPTFQRPLIRLESTSLTETVPKGQVTERSLASAVPLEVRAGLQSESITLVRTTLAENWKLILPYLCLWPWWWRFRCDEVAVLTTDVNGRFQTFLPYDCSGDHPDLYFWVEYDFGSGFETVYRPPLPCWTYWNYPCGNEVTIHVSDPRVPSCEDEPDPGGRQVWVISIGRTASIGEIYTSAAGALEGMVREPFGPSGGGEQDYAFGGKLEPRVWFGRTDLLADGITHYLWSVRPLGGAESEWAPLSRQVIRHFTTAGGTAPVDVMGPELGGANAGRFRIRPPNPPAGGIEWLVADEREDLASAHFVTNAPPVPPSPPPCGVADLAAGKYELKLELFDSAGALVVWPLRGVTGRFATTEAPFGAATVETDPVDSYHQIVNGSGQMVAFRMVLHVDNSRTGAEIEAVSGSGISVDPDRGVVTLTGSAPTLDVVFNAGRPGGLARFRFLTRRGLSTDIAQASAAGGVSDPSANGFTRSLPCTFTKTGLAATTLLGTCDQGAFSETLWVWALTTDGYSRLYALDDFDVAAFMLTKPCPPFGGQGRGGGGGGGP